MLPFFLVPLFLEGENDGVYCGIPVFNSSGLTLATKYLGDEWTGFCMNGVCRECNPNSGGSCGQTVCVNGVIMPGTSAYSWPYLASIPANWQLFWIMVWCFVFFPCMFIGIGLQYKAKAA
jgi:hypothetical protein